MKRYTFPHIVNSPAWEVDGIVIVNGSDDSAAIRIEHYTDAGGVSDEDVEIGPNQRHYIPRPKARMIKVYGPDDLMFVGYQRNLDCNALLPLAPVVDSVP